MGGKLILTKTRNIVGKDLEENVYYYKTLE